MDTTAEAPATAPLASRPRGKSRAKQSPADRLARLEEVRCPVHGWGMATLHMGLRDERGRLYDLLECCRKNCHILVRGYRGRTEDFRDPWGQPVYRCRGELLPEWVYLLEEGGEERADLEACRRLFEECRRATFAYFDAVTTPGPDGNAGDRFNIRTLEDLLRAAREGFRPVTRLRPMPLPAPTAKKAGGKKRR